MKNLLLAVTVTMALSFQATSALSDSQLLIQLPAPFASSTIRPFAGMLGVVGKVDVGASDVDIEEIGMFLQVHEAQNVRWQIFKNAAFSLPLVRRIR